MIVVCNTIILMAPEETMIGRQRGIVITVVCRTMALVEMIGHSKRIMICIEHKKSRVIRIFQPLTDFS